MMSSVLPLLLEASSWDPRRVSVGGPGEKCR